MKTVLVYGEELHLQQLVAVVRDKVRVELAPEARQRVQSSRDYIEGRMAAGDVMYGVNTGFGAFSSVRISPDQLAQLQVNLIRSHSSGVGQPFSREETRAILLLRANTLARGHSGVRPVVIDALLSLLNADVLPCIPSQGSVGASGDLAPLSHLALALIGEGYVWGSQGEKVLAGDALNRAGLQPLSLQAKEGLSLINGCQVMSAVGALALARTETWLKALDIAGAMSLEALRGSRGPFMPRISEVRPHPGEAETARNLVRILGEESEISRSHAGCNKVQDAYSLRCMPAVHGAAKSAWGRAIQTLQIEFNSSTDNPLVFSDLGIIISCGNFHGAPVAAALDMVAIPLASAANMSQCRLEKLINPALSDLPAFLAPQGGLNSGFMIVQVASAALASENKGLCHPASVDSIPTSADKEDHVSMGTIAARKLLRVVENAENMVAMEILGAAQGLDLLRPLQPAAGVLTALQAVRRQVPFAAEDRVFADDIEAVRRMLPALVAEVEKQIGTLEGVE